MTTDEAHGTPGSAGPEMLAGGCLCEQVRFRIPHAFKGGVAHCHCRMCRRAAASVAVTWVTVPKDAFTLDRGALTTYRSSDHGARGFCGSCGTPVTFWTAHAPDYIDVALCALDDADRLPATRHVWTASRLPWLTLDPDLPESAGE